MGLDVIYFSKLQFQFASDAEYQVLKKREKKKLALLEVNPDFQQYANNFQTGYYIFKRQGSFCAGSYRLYNQWRDTLCLLANNKPALDLIMAANIAHGKNTTGNHFFELIFFADDRGVLGSKVCQKLYCEFTDWRNRISFSAASLPAQDGFDYAAWFMTIYDSFGMAFRTASDSGCIYFT